MKMIDRLKAHSDWLIKQGRQDICDLICKIQAKKI